MQRNSEEGMLYSIDGGLMITLKSRSNSGTKSEVNISDMKSNCFLDFLGVSDYF